MKFAEYRELVSSVGLAASLSLLSPTQAAACTTVSGGQNLNYFSSYELPYTGSYSTDGSDKQEPISLSGCGASAGRYVMFAFGPDEAKIGSDLKDISYNGVLTDDGCHLKNSPFPRPYDFTVRQQDYQAKSKFFSQCVEADIGDLGATQIDYPEINQAAR